MAAKVKKPEAAPVAPELPKPAPLTLPRFSPVARLSIYFCSVLAPGTGLALGMLYFAQEDKDAKRFGVLCLVFGFLGILVRLGGQGNFHSFQSGESLTQPYY